MDEQMNEWLPRIWGMKRSGLGVHSQPVSPPPEWLPRDPDHPGLPLDQITSTTVCGMVNFPQRGANNYEKKGSGYLTRVK